MIQQIKDWKELCSQAVVVGHKDLPGASTQCPGFDVASWWAGVIRKETTAPRPIPKPSPIMAFLTGFLSLFRSAH